MAIKKSTCLFCSLGCELKYETGPFKIERLLYDSGSRISGGNLCPRGNFTTEFTNSMNRLKSPMLKKGRKHIKLNWNDAFLELQNRFSKLRPASVGFLLDGLTSCEEAYFTSLMQEKLGVNIYWNLPGDLELAKEVGLLSDQQTIRDISEIENFQTFVIIGNIFISHPIIAKRILNRKYEVKGNNIIVIDPKVSNTALLSNQHIQNNPGSESYVLAALAQLIANRTEMVSKLKDIEINMKKVVENTGISEAKLNQITDIIINSKNVLFITNNNINKYRDIESICGFIKLILTLKENSKVLPLFTFGNTKGIVQQLDINRMKSVRELKADMNSGRLDALVILGSDPAVSCPDFSESFQKLDLKITSSYFRNKTAEMSDIILAEASWMQKSGTYINFEGKLNRLEPVLEPRSEIKNRINILNSISRILGFESEIDKLTFKLERKVREVINFDQLNLKNPAPQTSKKNEMLLFCDESDMHFGDDSITREISWVKINFEGPIFKINPADAESMGIKEDKEIEISNSAGKASGKIKIDPSVLQSNIISNYCFSSIKSLWVQDKKGPVTVNLKI